MRSLLLAAVTASALAALVPDARAAAITQALPVSGAPIDFRDFGVDAFVRPFDPTLGTLTAVTLRLTGTLTPGLEAFDVPSPLPAFFAAPVTLAPLVSIASPGGATQALPAETLAFAQGGTPRRQLLTGTPEAVDLSETVAPDALLMLPRAGAHPGHRATPLPVPHHLRPELFFHRVRPERDHVRLSGRAVSGGGADDRARDRVGDG